MIAETRVRAASSASRTTCARSRAGYECGIALDSFDAIQEGDIFEFYHKERIN